MSFVLPHLPVGRRGVDDPVCYPHLLRLPRLDDAAGEDEVEGAGQPDQLREADLEKKQIMCRFLQLIHSSHAFAIRIRRMPEKKKKSWRKKFGV